VAAPSTERLGASLSQEDVATLHKFMTSVERQISQSWYLHGDAVVVMVSDLPYLISPDRDTPVKGPERLRQELGNVPVQPDAIAKVAKINSGVTLLLWVPDVPAAVRLARHPGDADNLSYMSQKGLLRGFLDGEEQTKESAGKISKAELLKLGWNTLWLRGGLGSTGVLRSALDAIEQPSLLEQEQVSIGGERIDPAREWMRTMMRATPSDGLSDEVLARTTDWLSGLSGLASGGD